MATKSKRITSATIRENRGRDMSPKWDGSQEWDGDKFTSNFREAMRFYSLEKSVKDLKPQVIRWMEENDFTKSDIGLVRKAKDSRFNSTLCGVVACLLRGMPEVHEGFNNGKDTGSWVHNEIAKLIKESKDDVEPEIEVKVTVVVPIVTIQDRIREQAVGMSEELDGAIDAFITDPETFDPKAFKIANLLRGKGAKAAQARYIKSFFQNDYNELLELASGEADEQLREAYSHLARKNVKKLIDFYESIIAACDQIATEAKTLKKPRKAKIKPAEDLVKKVKFKVSDDKLGISSVPPATIIGAQMAVTYNTKTRKFGVYTAKTSDGLGVKGTTITNFTDKSTQKTLRKPDAQIKEFKDQNTANRVKTWFDKIKATEVKLNGRINAEIMILKVFK
jgi:hypothetical protein